MTSGGIFRRPICSPRSSDRTGCIVPRFGVPTSNSRRMDFAPAPVGAKGPDSGRSAVP